MRKHGTSRWPVSVSPSHSCIVCKQLNVIIGIFLGHITLSFQVSEFKRRFTIQRGTSLSGGDKQTWVQKILQFSVNISLYLGNSRSYARGYHWTLVGSHSYPRSVRISSEDLEWLERQEREGQFFREGGSPYVRLYRLTRSDQIWHGYPCGGGACLLGFRYVPCPKERGPSDPQCWGFSCLHNLTLKDQIRRGNTYGEAEACFMGSATPWHNEQMRRAVVGDSFLWS